VANAQQRDAVEVVEVDGGADDLEHVRQQRDACARLARGFQQLEGHRVREAVRPDDQAVSSGTGDDLQQRLRFAGDTGSAQHRFLDRDTGHEVRRQRVAVEDRQQAYVGALVAREQAALARKIAQGQPARSATPEDRGDDEGHAEQDRLLLAGLPAEELLVAQPDAQYEQHPELSELGQLLDRRLADALTVALVQAEHLGGGDEAGEQQHRPRAERVRRGEDDDDQQRHGERKRVGERQRAAQAPLAPSAVGVQALGDLPPCGRFGIGGRRRDCDGPGRPGLGQVRTLTRPFAGSGLVHERSCPAVPLIRRP